MVLQLKSVFAGDATSVPIDTELDFSSLEWQGVYPFAKPIRIQGQVSETAGVVRLSATVTYTYDGVCDRCAEPMSDNRSFQAEHILVTEIAGEDNEDFLVVENFELPLDELMQADLLLNLPMKNLCKPDCQGLCPSCGQNLNQGSCGCQHKEVDPRLEILKQFIN